VLLEQNRPGVSENGGTANLVPGKNRRAPAWPAIYRDRFAMNFKLELRSGKALCAANQSSDVKHRMIAFALKT
jgi:hypothetical protein